MCNITLRFVSGLGCYLIEDLGLSISSVEENLVSHLFSVQDLTESHDLNTAILNGDLEAKVDGQIVNQLCSPGVSGSDSWSYSFDIKAVIELNEILFNDTPIIITRNCVLSSAVKASDDANPDWVLSVLKSEDNGGTWSEVFPGSNFVKNTLLKVKLIKGINQVLNPRVVLDFQVQNSSYDTWDRASNLKGDVGFSSVDFDVFLIHKNCTLSDITGRGSADWRLEVLSRTNQAASWSVIGSLDVNQFSSISTNVSITAGSLVKARFVRKDDNVLNPQVSLTFRV